MHQLATPSLEKCKQKQRSLQNITFDLVIELVTKQLVEYLQHVKT